MADKKDTRDKKEAPKETKAPKSVEVEKKPTRAKKADAPAAETTEAKPAQRRSGKVTGIADVSAALKTVKAEVAAPQAANTVQGEKSHIDAQGRAHATGRRKDASARVILKRGAGRIIINGRTQEQYFARPVLRMIISKPFAVANRLGQYDVQVSVAGGGLSGQAGAVRHGLSRALVYMEPELRGVLKKMGFLTRDSRTVERKKFGQRKARRRFQFSKR